MYRTRLSGNKWGIVLVVTALVALAYGVVDSLSLPGKAGASLALETPDPGSTQARTSYYVSLAGNDSNPGTRAQPWRTIQKAANTMVGGDTVMVQPGTYAEHVTVTRSGAAGAPITFQASGATDAVSMLGFTINASYVTVRGFFIANTPNDDVHGYGIYLQGSNCLFENNDVYYATRGGIYLYAAKASPNTTSNNVVRNNLLQRNSQWGITVTGQNNLIEDNEIWRSLQYPASWPNPPSGNDADGIRFFGSGHTIRRNYIHDILYTDPENVNPHIDCFQTFDDDNFEAGHDILFERNRCENLQAHDAYENGQGFMIEGGRHLTIQNNIIHAFRIINATDSPELVVANNTFGGSLTYKGHNPGGVVLTRSPNAVVKNNEFYDVGAGVQPYIDLKDYESRQGLQVSENRVYMTDASKPYGTLWPGDSWPAKR